MARHRHKRRRARPDAALQQAALESEVRFGPEAFQLSELLHQARSDYLTQVKIERGTARAVKASTRATIPKTKKDYADSLRFGRQQQKVVNQKLGELSPAADDIKAASVRESSGAQRRLRESQANATAELRDRISQADAAAAFGVTSAKSQYASDRSQIGRQLLNLARQKGTFTIADAQALRKADRQFKLGLRGQNITRRGQNLTLKGKKLTARETRRHNRASERATNRANRLAAAKERRIARGGGKGKGKGGAKGLTRLQNNAAVDAVDFAVSLIRSAPSSKGPHAIRSALLSGRGGKSKPVPKWAVNAAMDIVYKGKLSRPNVANLRGRGVKIPHTWRHGHPTRRASRSGRAFSGARARGSV